MNTVGKPGWLGDSSRCAVSVSMLTEGWDANTVTHVLGVRALGTRLLCEQVIGRALRRQSYDLNEDGLFKEKKSTKDTYWVPGVNNLGTHRRWAFAEFTDVFQMQADFAGKVEEAFEAMIANLLEVPLERAEAGG